MGVYSVWKGLVTGRFAPIVVVLIGGVEVMKNLHCYLANLPIHAMQSLEVSNKFDALGNHPCYAQTPAQCKV
jgi:putative sterol carrier protein